MRTMIEKRTLKGIYNSTGLYTEPLGTLERVEKIGPGVSPVDEWKRDI